MLKYGAGVIGAFAKEVAADLGACLYFPPMVNLSKLRLTVYEQMFEWSLDMWDGIRTREQIEATQSIAEWLHGVGERVRLEVSSPYHYTTVDFVSAKEVEMYKANIKMLQVILQDHITSGRSASSRQAPPFYPPLYWPTQLHPGSKVSVATSSAVVTGVANVEPAGELVVKFSEFSEGLGHTNALASNVSNTGDNALLIAKGKSSLHQDDSCEQNVEGPQEVESLELKRSPAIRVKLPG